MTNFLSNSLSWIATKIAPAAAPLTTSLNQRLLDWDYAQANDREIWDRESEKDRIKEAADVRRINPVASFELLSELAERGSLWSMLRVASAYEDGIGVARNPVAAEEWYRRAYEGGSERALLCYARLLGLRGDLSKCEEVYSVGAARDFAPALYWLARNRLRRFPNRRTRLEVRPLLERATAKGSLNAQKLLARKMLGGQFGLREIPRGLQLTLDVFRKLAVIANIVQG